MGSFSSGWKTDHTLLETIFLKTLFIVPARIQRELFILQKNQLEVESGLWRGSAIPDVLSRPYVLNAGRGDSEEADTAGHFMISSLISYWNYASLQTLRQTIVQRWLDNGFVVPTFIRAYWPYREELSVSLKMTESYYLKVSEKVDFTTHESQDIRKRKALHWSDRRSQIK